MSETLDTLLTLDLAGKQIIDTSTIVPAILKTRITALAAKGACAVDAPISGGPELVLAGHCGIFIGGSDTDAARAQTTLAALSGRKFHVGPLGTGLVMKVINYAMLQVYFGGLAEMLPLAKRAGLPLDVAVGILCGGPAGIPMVRDRLPRILGEDASVAFAITAALKDNDVFRRVIHGFGLTAPTLDAAGQHERAAVAAGLGDHDVAALASNADHSG